MVLAPTLERLPDVRIHSPNRLDAPPSSPTFYHVSGVDAGSLERALSADRTVSDERCVVAGDTTRTYRLRVTSDAFVVSDPAAERGIQVHEATSRGEEWRLRLGAPDREALSDLRGYCRANDVSFTVERLCCVEDTWSGPAVLTEQQRRTLQTALDAGYFDVPRTATQSDLAERLDISGSAVSQRLRRATRQLVTSTIQPPTE